MRIICVGNKWRGDDRAGLAVAERLRSTLPQSVEVLEREGEPASLIDAWEDADSILLVDAVSSGAAPGTVHRVDVGERSLPSDVFRASTHALGLAEAVELARALGRLPRHAVVYGIEGRDFASGPELTPEVEAAVTRVAEAVRREVEECTKRH